MGLFEQVSKEERDVTVISGCTSAQVLSATIYLFIFTGSFIAQGIRLSACSGRVSFLLINRYPPFSPTTDLYGFIYA